MRLSASAALIALCAPVLVSAHGHHDARHYQYPRQSPASSPSAAPAATPAATTPRPSSSASVTSASATSAAPAAAPPAAAPSGSTTPSPSSSLPYVSVSLHSTNPTAVPLSFITANASLAPTHPLTTTYAPGSKPTGIPGAPPLPAVAIQPSLYPPLDKLPPTDSPEVQAWIQEVANSGVVVPSFGPTVAGGCPANPAAVADTSRCWWTCGGCTRATDVTTCPNQLTWGLTYDDGPAFYTPNLLEYLNSQNLRATFFTIGSRVISNPYTLQEQYMGGNQIGVHTWSHPPLTTLTNEQIIAELGWTRKAIKDVLGVTPNTMRPPYGDIDDRVRAIAVAMGMTPIMWTRISPMATFDTGDFNINAGTISAGQVLLNWQQILGNASTLNTGFIVLEHDLFEQCVDIATGYILPDALAHTPSFKIQPVIECLNKPLSDAYVETNDNATSPPPKDGGGVTLTSGAPGSAQATKASSATPNAGGDQLSWLLQGLAGLVGSAAVLF